jgi:ABC-type bacteriocin/lantibiotic exporter with double-glycine peptidase domain
MIKRNCDKDSRQQQILTRIQTKIEKIEWFAMKKKCNNAGPNMKATDKSKITNSLKGHVTTLFITLAKDQTMVVVSCSKQA